MEAKDLVLKAVREMVKTTIENRENLAIEGCYIPPDWRGDFEEEYSGLSSSSAWQRQMPTSMPISAR